MTPWGIEPEMRFDSEAIKYPNGLHTTRLSCLLSVIYDCRACPHGLACPAMETFKDLKLALRVLRYQYELSQREAARLLGMPPTQLSKYETGKKTPTLPVLDRILSGYGVSMGYLVELLEVLGDRARYEWVGGEPVEEVAERSAGESPSSGRGDLLLPEDLVEALATLTRYLRRIQRDARKQAVDQILISLDELPDDRPPDED